jgi:hypothetical protein
MPPCLDDNMADGTGMLPADEGPKLGSAQLQTDGFADRRTERQKFGLIKYNLEKGVPDVGGLGWRSKQGHVLKNQSYYSAFPNTNIWNNPSHAGPRTWKSFHGPKLRTDANLMDALDRLDEEQAKWEVKKLYVNTVRVQTLDRFYNQKVQNEQREISHSWAPHRRAKREFHAGNEGFEAELDSLPKKELLKVLTPSVLHGDREAIRNITMRIQREETWKATWKEMEAERRLDTLSDLEERMTYNQMLADLAGQPTRRRDPSRKLPNNCSERLEELAQPKGESHLSDVTQMTDFRGLIHVSHPTALEARFPGYGQEFSRTFREKVNECAPAGWPPPDRPETPHTRKREPQKKESRATLKCGSVPANEYTLNKAMTRTTADDLIAAAQEQIGNEAPPAPEQHRMLLEHKIVNDPEVMNEVVSHSLSGSPQVSIDNLEHPQKLPPPQRPLTYPVLVEVSPKTSSQRIAKTAARLGGNLDATASDMMTQSMGSAPSSARRAVAQKKPALPMKDVKIARLGINIMGASGLRAADRANGRSDPFCVVRVPGRPKSKYTTRVIKTTLNPVWRESYELQEFFAGDVLEFTVYDKDSGGSESLGKCVLPQARILPAGVDEELDLFDEKRPQECPSLRVKVVALENFDPDGRLQAKAVRGAEDSDDEPPSVHQACQDLDDFEASLRPVPRLGNFWMTPRGDMRNTIKGTSRTAENASSSS